MAETSTASTQAARSVGSHQLWLLFICPSFIQFLINMLLVLTDPVKELDWLR